MSENQDEKVEIEELDNLDDEKIQTISLKRHYWPDEEEIRSLKKQLRRSRLFIIWGLVIALLLGWFLGTLWPMGGRYSSLTYHELDSTSKINAVISLLEENWFFKDEFDDLDTTLTDQALSGVTDNAIDPHTEYMSADEAASFTQTINRSYVGIGVSYTTTGGVHIIQDVYKASPADKAGVKPGDIIHAVDGVEVDGMSSDEVKELVTGEKGTDVTITFLRQGEEVTLTITRGEVSATAAGEILDDHTAYLQLYQFGEGTGKETAAYLDDFKAAGVTKLILDLRDNGGGYLDALQETASLFLENGSTILTQVFSDTTESALKANGTPCEEITEIVVLVNANTASASEAMTLALKENRPDDVTIVGVTTYGKGTAQLTRSFDDGSALKYTTSKWLSPNGNWINNIGIEPDEEVRLHDVFYRSMAGMDSQASYAYDDVSEAVADIQLCLDYLGYDPDRQDGYLSHQTLSALQAFGNDEGITVGYTLTYDLYKAVLSAVSLKWNTTRDTDTQYQKALEILNG